MHSIPLRITLLALASAASLGTATAAVIPAEWQTTGTPWLDAYFAAETQKLADRNLADIQTKENWLKQRDSYRGELREMLGLEPWPDRTDLHATITGTLQREGFVVENLHFQSMPGLYVTANLYRPAQQDQPLPAILYVCGHGGVKKDGISYGNKVHYQHHGEWFARNGYVCLIIDTVQLGEIEGIHHGTYREGMWWWNSRGYTSAGAEAWNCVRALDYLTSRPEVDATRMGVTGRSGGGAYSWWIAALDERVKVAVPVAGITDLHNYVVDGCVEGHCDCMFMVNTYRWDYSKVAALVAPRPLLISNSDKDRLFPLSGVTHVHSEAARIYDLLGASDKLGLLITEGPHQDTQDLQVPAFRWFNRWLKDDTSPVRMVADTFCTPQELKVFDKLPEDERTSTIYETFNPKAELPPVPTTTKEWTALRDGWTTGLKEKCFRGWPDSTVKQPERASSTVYPPLNGKALPWTTQDNVELQMYVFPYQGPRNFPGLTLEVLGREDWPQFLGAMAYGCKEMVTRELAAFPKIKPDEAAFNRFSQRIKDSEADWMVLVPRGVGLTDWTQGILTPISNKKEVQIRRRFMLLGQTVDSMQVWDILQGLRLADSGYGGAPLKTIHARGDMAVNALYAFVIKEVEDHPDKTKKQLVLDALKARLIGNSQRQSGALVNRLILDNLPASHREGPDYLNVLRVLDIPQAVAMAAENAQVTLSHADPKDWQFPQQVIKSLHWPTENLTIKSGE